MKKNIVYIVLSTVLIALNVNAADFEYGKHRCRPVGTWLINIEFPDSPQPLRFQELLTLNADRTLSETNTALHPNTPTFATPPNAPPITGSDGFGNWRRLSGCRIEFSVLKFVFAGADLAPPQVPAFIPQGIPIGFFKVSGIAHIIGNTYTSELGSVKSELLLGFDPQSPDVPPISFGDAVSIGHRLLATD